MRPATNRAEPKTNPMEQRNVLLCPARALSGTFFSGGGAVAPPLPCNIARASSPGRTLRGPPTSPNLSRQSPGLSPGWCSPPTPVLGDSFISLPLLVHNSSTQQSSLQLNPDAVPFSPAAHPSLPTFYSVRTDDSVHTDDLLELDDEMT